MTYTFKLSKRMAIIWRLASWTPLLAALGILAAFPLSAKLANLPVLGLAMALAKLLTGGVSVKRFILSHGNQRRDSAVIAGGRRIRDQHPVWELFDPSGRIVWRFVFVGFTRVIAE